MNQLKRILLATATGSCLTIGAVQIAHADQVILDDLIVDGSACIGLDCVNGESFGFDTIRLKENNTRIRFFDTSASASFPSNDWQLTANDSSNGGANKFSIDDIDGGRTPFTIEASAPNNSLFVENSGQVGFGTSNPVVNLHVVEGNTPTLRLEQDGSSGFTPQTWDVAGNEANFFIRDVTNGSRLSFRIRPGALESSIDVAGDGDVGIGTSSPATQLHVRETSAAVTAVRIENANAAGQNTDIQLKNTMAEWRMRNNTAGSFVINDTSDGVFELELSPTGDLTIEGGLITSTAGTCNAGTPCDRTFQPDFFTVPSIDEHAQEMWKNSYLKGVGPTKAGEPMNLTTKTGGILHELEVAHIYIEQLHKRLSEIEAKLADSK
jgi:hypothetical protein